MALSMDEQRMLAEIERRLSAEDPRLAARLSSFKRPGPSATFRTPRGRIIGSLLTVALVAVISIMVYAMAPFRAHGPKSISSPQASSPSISAPAHIVASPNASAGTSVRASTAATARTTTPARSASASTARSSATTSKTSTVKAGSRPAAGKTAGTKTAVAATAGAG